jgi:hypothetical protein
MASIHTRTDNGYHRGVDPGDQKPCLRTADLVSPPGLKTAGRWGIGPKPGLHSFLHRDHKLRLASRAEADQGRELGDPNTPASCAPLATACRCGSQRGSYWAERADGASARHSVSELFLRSARTKMGSQRSCSGWTCERRGPWGSPLGFLASPASNQGGDVPGR